MHTKLFDYIFRQRQVAQPGQPIKIFTTQGEVISGRFKCYYNDNNISTSVAELLEIELPNIGKNIFKSSEILKLKLTFKDENIIASWYTSNLYSLDSMLKYVELLLRAEVVLSDKIINGFIMSYPNDFYTAYDEGYIHFLGLDGNYYSFTRTEVKEFNFIFEHQQYNEILYCEQ